MSFAQQLYKLPAERLRSIVHNRSRSFGSTPRIESKRDLTHYLAEALTRPNAVAEGLMATNLLQMQVLTCAILEGSAAAFDSVVAILGEEARERIWEAANTLELLGLVVLSGLERQSGPLGSGITIFVPGGVRANTPLPLPLTNTLPSALANYNAPAIQAIYNAVGATGGAITKQARIDAITAILTSADLVKELLNGLAETDIQLLWYVLQQSGVATLTQLAQKLEARQRNQLYSYDWATRWYQGQPRNPAEQLLVRGLLVLDGAVGWGYGYIVCPGNVIAAITGKPLFNEGAADLPDWDTVPETDAAIRRHHSLGRDIAYLIGFLGRTDASRTTKGLIHRNVLKSVAKNLSISTADYAGFVYSLAREADLIAPQGKRAMYDVTEQGLAWLEMEPAEQLKSLFEIWKVQIGWMEISIDPLGDGGVRYYADDLRSYRDHAMTLLRQLQSDRPSAFASLESLSRRAEYLWWNRFPPRPESAESIVAQDEGEGDESLTARAVLLRLLAQSLFWLGLTEIIDDNKGQPQYLRLTARGRSLLAGQAVDSLPDTETVDKFILQPNLEIYTPPNLSPHLLYRLFRIAEPSSRSGSQLALTSDTVRRALDRGETAESILELFREHSQTGVPQNVEYLIREVGGKHGHIHIGQAGIYIHVADSILLKEIQAQKKLGIRFRRMLTDTVALVTGDSVDSILKQLRLAGYLPVSDEESSSATTKLPRAERRYVPPAQPEVRSHDFSLRVDWAAVEREDGSSFALTEPVRTSGSTGTQPSNKNSLLERAVRNREVLSVRYQPDKQNSVQEREIEPIGMAGSLLRAFDRTKGDTVLLNTRYITTLRLTGERFEKR